MNLGDYFLASDLVKLDRDEFNSLVSYLKFMGVSFKITRHRIKSIAEEGGFILSYLNGRENIMVWASSVNCANRIRPYSEIRRMVSLGRVVHEN